MNHRFFVTGRFMTRALAVSTGAFLTACTASSGSPPPPGPGALGDASGPTQPCTLIGCTDGLTVALESGTEWPDGDYRFDIRVDGVRVTCRGSLPVPSCTESKDASPPTASVTCDPIGVVQIVESGCALPRVAASTLGRPDTVTAQRTPAPGTPTSAPVPPPASPPVTHAFPAIMFDPELRPQEVEIAVSWNRKLVGRTAFAPRFERVQPNGPACPATCNVARSTLTLAF
jgi:hypothetical protein